MVSKKISLAECIGKNNKFDTVKLYQRLHNRELLRVCANKILFVDGEHQCYFFSDDETRQLCGLLEQDLIDIIPVSVLDNVIKKLKHTPDLEISPNKLDANPNLINTCNQVVDIRTLSTFEPQLKYGFVGFLDFRFLKDANLTDAPNFLKFCQSSLQDDETKRRLLLEMIGYSICNDFSLKQACFFEGSPHSGKSVILRLTSDVYGPWRTNNMTLAEISRRFSTAHLALKHLNINGDNEGDILKNVAKFKQILGGDRIMGEFKGKDAFMFLPRVHMLFGCNELPALKEIQLSTAFIDRITLLHFPKSIDRSEWDSDLYNKLYAERDVIFSLAIKALSEIYKNGRLFSVDADSKAVYERYKAIINPVQAFIDTCCILESSSKIFKSDFVLRFEQWCQENAVPYHIDDKTLESAVCSVGNVLYKKIRIGKETNMGFQGIAYNNSKEDSEGGN